MDKWEMFWLGIAVSCVISYVIQDNENKKLERELADSESDSL